MEWIGWPLAVVVISFGFMLLFRSSIHGLIGRTKSVGKAGLETFDREQTSASQSAAQTGDPLGEFLRSYDNQLLRETEELLDRDLQQRGLTDPDSARKALLRSLAGTTVLLRFESAHAVIWQSQLWALDYLNSRGTPTPIEGLKLFYENAKNRYPERYQEYSFERWLGFLRSRGLVTNAPNDHITISVAGREFLKWRIETGRSGPFEG